MTLSCNLPGIKKVILLKSGAKNQGGLEKSALRIAAAFAARGAEVTLLTTGKGSPFPVRTERLKTTSWLPFLRMEQFDRFVRKWLEENGADLIFGMDRNRFQTHLRAGNGVHAAFLESRQLTEGKWKYYSCLVNPMHRKILQLEKEAITHPRLKKVIANSHMVKKQILERFSVDPKKVEVVHNGVEWREMEEDFRGWPEGKKAVCQRYGLDPSAFHLLFVGHGYLRKGLDQLLLGLSRLKRKDIHLSVIGKEKRLEAYRAKATQLGLEGQVTFFGPQKEILPFYQLADALAIPSFYDPFANVTVEALAMGLYTLSSRHNGGAEVIDSQSGHLIEDLLSIDSMVEALENALRHPKTAESAVGIRESVRSLDFSHQMQKLMDICYE